MPDKLVSLEEALALVPDGCAITAGGFAHSHQPMGFFRALIAEGRKDLSIMGVAECWVAEWLAAAGMLRRAWFSNFMFEGFGRCRRFSEAIEAGEIETEDHSHFGMVMRLVAGGQRLPFMPVLSQGGTDIVSVAGFERPEDKVQSMTSPFPDGRVVTVTSPLNPDVAIIHAARADRLGNVQLFGASSVIEEQTGAARKVIVTVEEIVPSSTFRARPEATLLPGLMVDAVVHLPFGAWPTGVYGYHDPDLPFLRDYYEASREPAACKAWIDRHVRSPRDHWDWLDRAGIVRLLALRTDPVLGYRPAEDKS
ncbi:CoA-transferase [Chelativorans sp. AA-79]|uniref:CoA transferase subunit A n=1 Tax=Chelativorans sp. AA-79 TaxID=3028735 RepID=UPI0023F9AEFA|nr:CoA-transferase [Chelativorans sp. AA-79]WEX07262.1 CoA-transferase [Chelativorans sp. AA-79]